MNTIEVRVLKQEVVARHIPDDTTICSENLSRAGLCYESAPRLFKVTLIIEWQAIAKFIL